MTSRGPFRPKTFYDSMILYFSNKNVSHICFLCDKKFYHFDARRVRKD